jgi:ankyrin repeat protein
MTPLHWACANKHLEGIICLLEHGADVNIEDEVSTATSGLAVMVEMVVVGGEG